MCNVCPREEGLPPPDVYIGGLYESRPQSTALDQPLTLTFLHQSHIDANGRDLDWATPGWMASRCPGAGAETEGR